MDRDMDRERGSNRDVEGDAAKSGAGRAGRRGTSAPFVQSVTRALALLEEVARRPEGAALGDLAASVGLAPSTAHRLLTTLENQRFVRFDREPKRWTVGIRAFVVGNAFARSRGIVVAAMPAMRQLMEEAGETVNLAVRDGDRAVYLAQVECHEMMRAFAGPGARVPLYCSAVGKALLAALPEAEARRAMAHREMPRATPNTIVDGAVLSRELEASRVRGYATDDEEHAIGLRCVAAPVFDEDGRPVAAVSVSGPSARITDDRLDTLGGLVGQACRRITMEIGGRVPPLR